MALDYLSGEIMAGRINERSPLINYNTQDDAPEAGKENPVSQKLRDELDKLKLDKGQCDRLTKDPKTLKALKNLLLGRKDLFGRRHNPAVVTQDGMACDSKAMNGALFKDVMTLAGALIQAKAPRQACELLMGVARADELSWEHADQLVDCFARIVREKEDSELRDSLSDLYLGDLAAVVQTVVLYGVATADESAARLPASEFLAGDATPAGVEEYSLKYVPQLVQKDLRHYVGLPAPSRANVADSLVGLLEAARPAGHQKVIAIVIDALEEIRPIDKSEIVEAALKSHAERAALEAKATVGELLDNLHLDPAQRKILESDDKAERALQFLCLGQTTMETNWGLRVLDIAAGGRCTFASSKALKAAGYITEASANQEQVRVLAASLVKAQAPWQAPVKACALLMEATHHLPLFRPEGSVKLIEQFIQIVKDHKAFALLDVLSRDKKTSAFAATARAIMLYECKTPAERKKRVAEWEPWLPKSPAKSKWGLIKAEAVVKGLVSSVSNQFRSSSTTASGRDEAITRLGDMLDVARQENHPEAAAIILKALGDFDPNSTNDTVQAILDNHQEQMARIAGTAVAGAESTRPIKARRASMPQLRVDPASAKSPGKKEPTSSKSPVPTRSGVSAPVTATTTTTTTTSNATVNAVAGRRTTSTTATPVTTTARTTGRGRKGGEKAKESESDS
jgi:hypothetical protein